ncbi:MAG TPA: AI-2E family transporter [Patescibacteria group bacterium]|nr:AI-2E family transporter [Patescibacteria group bacterium]
MNESEKTGARGVWRQPIFCVFCVFALVVSLLYVYAKTILIILFITVLLFILLDPVAQRLSRSMPPRAAILLTLAGFIGIVLLLLVLSVRTVLPDLTQVARDFPAMASQFDAQVLFAYLPPEVAEYGRNLLKDAATFAINMLKESIGPLVKAVSGVVELIAVPFLTYYLLADGRRVCRTIGSYLPPEFVAQFAAFMHDVGAVLGGYIRGQVLIALFSGFVVFLGASLFGLPYAPILALVSMVSEFVPVVGTVVATVPGVLLALVYSPWLALQVLAFYVLLLKVNHNIIYPKVVGKAVRVHPVFIMTAILAFGHLLGIIGMLFAVPALAVTRVWLLHVLGKPDTDM